MSNLSDLAHARNIPVERPSFTVRLGRPWIEEAAQSVTPIEAQALRDLTARRRLGLSIKSRFPLLVEAAA